MIDSMNRFEIRLGETEEVFVDYDDDRQGWWFRGCGFDFFAYSVVGDCFEADAARAGDRDGSALLIRVRCGPSGLVSADVFASKALKELSRYWFIEGSPFHWAMLEELRVRGELTGGANV